MIRKIFLLTMGILVVLAGTVSAQAGQIADVAVYNMVVSADQESLGFDVVNNGNSDEHNVQYGISLKDVSGQLIKKVLMPDSYSLKSGSRVRQDITYPIGQYGATSMVLFVVNDNGLPLAVSMINLETKKRGAQKPISVNTIKSCEVLNTEEGYAVSCANQEAKDLIKITVFEKTVFGKEVSSEEFIWKQYHENNQEEGENTGLNTLEKQDIESNSMYWLPEITPGFYKIRIENSEFERTLDLLVEGVYAKINGVSLDKNNYQEADRALMSVSIAASEEKVQMLYGVMNGENDICSFEGREWTTNVTEIPLTMNEECSEASPFVVVLDSEENILTEYGTREKSIQELSKVKNSIVQTTLSNWKIMMYGAIIIFVVGLIMWLAKKRTLSVSLIIIAIMLGLGAFGYSKVFAATFSGQNNIYTVNFSQEEYGTEDVVSFTLGFFDKNTFTKSTDSSVSVAVDGGAFNEVVSALDTQEVYQIALGKMTEGDHKIQVQGITAARFNIAKFGFSKFGQSNDELVFSIKVKNTCVVDQNSWSPLAEAKCENVLFNQVSNCETTREVWGGKKDCPEDFCALNPTDPKCLTVDDKFCDLYPTDPLCTGNSNYCKKYPTAPSCTTCVVNDTHPKAADICSGVQFVQNTNCPDTNYIKTGTNTTKPECIKCIVDENSWTPPTSTYCAGDKFTQTSNCSSTRVAIGTNPSATCTPAQNAQLLCATNLQSPWFACDSKIITLASGYSPLYIRPETDVDKVTNWLFQDSDGGINAVFKEGENGLEDIITTMKPTGNGIHGNNKFYNLDVRAVGATAEYTTIQLKFINPVVVEI